MASAVTAANFEGEVLLSDVPVLVDFWAEWCAPCKAIAASIDQIAEEYAGRAKVFKVNVDEEGDLAARFGIMSIPAVLVFKGGQVVDQFVGSAPKSAYAGMLDRHI